MSFDPRTFLLSLFRAAVETASAQICVPPNLPSAPRGRTVVVGAGKAAAAMARAVEDNWQGPLSGLVITRYGHGAPCRTIRVVEAGHPVPDEAGQTAAAEMLHLVQGLTGDDLVLALISGGGSSLLALPAPGIPLADKQAVTRALLLCGAPISEFNCVRKHLSAVKGGRLALAAQPAAVASLIISDVPGDDPATVASGPTVPDPTSRAQALSILRKYAIAFSPAVRRWLEDAASETPNPGDPAFLRVENRVIATARDALTAAARVAEAQGIAVIDLGDAVEGEAREVARTHAALALGYAREGRNCLLLSGGETTVTVKGGGRGGRNSEYLLALAVALDEAPGIWAIACDTDGIDGTETNAGAIVTPDTLARAKRVGSDAAAVLAKNDAYGFFQSIGDLVETGPTRTNVNDFRAILIQPDNRP
ncbi:MAG TPA: glycerate kinase [Micropepsaceae bacterium]|nr:glycerate kinase [Micropepsaceae bacterium]